LGEIDVDDLFIKPPYVRKSPSLRSSKASDLTTPLLALRRPGMLWKTIFASFWHAAASTRRRLRLCTLLLFLPALAFAAPRPNILIISSFRIQHALKLMTFLIRNHERPAERLDGV